jgi:hypothetical protein
MWSLAFLTVLISTTVSMTLSPGWDVLSRPLDYHHSSASLDESASQRAVAIQFRLQGATPNTAHLAGIHFFWGPAGTPSLGKCIASFGQFKVDACAYACRQGTCRTYNSFELCTIATDAHGNGQCDVVANHVAPGRYELELTVRDFNRPVSAVIYQTPGPYGAGTLSFTMP